MKIKEGNKHAIELTSFELGFVKGALEYYFINSDELHVCKNCQKKLLGLVDRITKLTEGKTLTEKVTESKNSMRQA